MDAGGAEITRTIGIIENGTAVGAGIGTRGRTRTTIVGEIGVRRASGEIVAQQASITLPTAQHATPLEVAPIIAIDDRAVTLDGTRVADAATLAANADVSRIEQLIQNLNTVKQNLQVLHPGQDFPGMVIIQCDLNVDFRVIKKVMFSIAQAGFPNISFAVNGSGEEGPPPAPEH